MIGKFAHGIADDFLSSLYLATRAPVLMAPAMNTNMLEHDAVRRNMEMLAARGVRFVDPGAGYLACGWIGKGRLAEPDVDRRGGRRAAAPEGDAARPLRRRHRRADLRRHRRRPLHRQSIEREDGLRRRGRSRLARRARRARLGSDAARSSGRCRADTRPPRRRDAQRRPRRGRGRRRDRDGRRGRRLRARRRRVRRQDREGPGRSARADARADARHSRRARPSARAARLGRCSSASRRRAAIRSPAAARSCAASRST